MRLSKLKMLSGVFYKVRVHKEEGVGSREAKDCEKFNVESYQVIKDIMGGNIYLEFS